MDLGNYVREVDMTLYEVFCKKIIWIFTFLEGNLVNYLIKTTRFGPLSE
jgi:hypothetical protein